MEHQTIHDKGSGEVQGESASVEIPPTNYTNSNIDISVLMSFIANQNEQLTQQISSVQSGMKEQSEQIDSVKTEVKEQINVLRAEFSGRLDQATHNITVLTERVDKNEEVIEQVKVKQLELVNDTQIQFSKVNMEVTKINSEISNLNVRFQNLELSRQSCRDPLPLPDPQTASHLSADNSQSLNINNCNESTHSDIVEVNNGTNVSTLSSENCHKVSPQMSHLIGNDVTLPKFNDRPEQNPVRYVKELEAYFKLKNIPPVIQMPLVQASLGPLCNPWYELTCSGMNFLQFKEAFLEHFWDLNRQNQIRVAIANGKFDPRDNINYAEYFLRIGQKARMLTPPILDQEFIKIIASHFPNDIKNALIVAKPVDFREAIELLKALYGSHRGTQLLNPKEEKVTPPIEIDRKQNYREFNGGYRAQPNQRNYGNEPFRNRDSDRNNRYGHTNPEYNRNLQRDANPYNRPENKYRKPQGNYRVNYMRFGKNRNGNQEERNWRMPDDRARPHSNNTESNSGIYQTHMRTNRQGTVYYPQDTNEGPTVTELNPSAPPFTENVASGVIQKTGNGTLSL